MPTFLPIYEAFSVTSLFCFVVLAIYGLFAAWSTEREPPYRAGVNTVTVIAAIFFLLFSNAARVFDDLHRLTFWVAIYLIGGPIWGVIHWLLFVLRRRNLFLKVRMEFNGGRSFANDAERKDFEMFLERYRDDSFTFTDDAYYPFCSDGYGGAVEVIPLAKHNASRITAWMMYWPLSIVGWVLQDALRWLVTDCLWQFWRWIQSRFSTMFDAISKSIFGGIADEFKGGDKH